MEWEVALEFGRWRGSGIDSESQGSMDGGSGGRKLLIPAAYIYFTFSAYIYFTFSEEEAYEKANDIM